MELEIEGLLDEGWKPRIKKRKKLRYITLRKGNQEKSLGPYTEELWEKVKPADPWATLAHVSELEKRLSKVEGSKRDLNPSLDSLVLNRIEKMEEVQKEAKKSLNKLFLRFEKMRKDPLESDGRKLERKIRKLENTQRGSKSSFDALLLDFNNMQDELIESAERRLTKKDTCKQINNEGFCLLYYFSYDEIEKLECLKPMGYSELEGKKVYHIKVREHPLVCSACPDYEPKS